MQVQEWLQAIAGPSAGHMAAFGSHTSGKLIAAISKAAPVSTWLMAEPVTVFQKRMQRSAVPPPEARRPCW